VWYKERLASAEANLSCWRRVWQGALGNCTHKESVMGKGNNSQKNDKKNKKAKKTGLKKPDAKAGMKK
jgi:hypothetical protein